MRTPVRTRREFLRALAGAGVVPVTAGSHPAAAARAGSRRPMFEERPLFLSGLGYTVYRIPALLTTRRGTVLAFAEGRQTGGDHSQNDIVLRRSRDASFTWDPLIVVAQDRPNALVNPTVVEVRETGRVILMYQRYPAGFHERAVVPGYDGPRVCRTLIRVSDDDGASWSAPREITRQVKRPTGATSTACGPGIAVQLQRGARRGRLVVPFNQGPTGAWKVYAALSDDRGETWRYGATAPDADSGLANEVQMVELADGRLMLNARSMGGRRCRKVASSSDGGESWSPLADATELPDPECQGTIIRYSWPGAFSRGRLLFANAASAKAREHGTVRVSEDEGRTWRVSRVVCASQFAYSCLTVLADGTIGLLYERDEYGSITFARFDLDWLRGTADYPPDPSAA